MFTKNTVVYETLLVEEPHRHVMLVTLNRPEVSNAFNTLMGEEIVHLFEQLPLDSHQARCLIVTGAGEKAFCAGGDLKERNGMSDEVWGRQHLVFERMVRAIKNSPIPAIGAINGAAYGGGCEVACLMDFIYVAEHARFALPEAMLGIMPGAGGTQTLPRAVGERRAKEIMLSATSFSAQQALEWGLANAVFPGNQLLQASLDTAQKIATNAPVSIRQIKQAIHRGLQMSLSDGLAFEIEAYNRTVPTEDRREGVLAFNEKRRPVFKGQ